MATPLESWLGQHGLSEIEQSLRECYVVQLSDLQGLDLDDVEELSGELGVDKVTQRKFIAALTKLIEGATTQL